MPGGQPAYREQAHRPGYRHVDDRRVGKALVDTLEILGRHADATILNFDHCPCAGTERMAGDQHLCCRWRERCRVLQQFGDEVHDVTHRVSGDRYRGRGRLLHPRVLLHLGDGGEDDLVERDGVGPAASGVGTGEDQQALVVPPHTGGEVVEFEQVGELVGVLLPVLQIVDQP